MVREVKEATQRRQEILRAAAELFFSQGFDNTSMQDVQERVGIARGTLYYHFDSKEDMLDALIDQMSGEMLKAARSAAKEPGLPLLQRFMKVLMAVQVSTPESKHLLEQMHRPQNVLLHQKSQQVLLRQLSPILAELVREGVKEGVFNTPYPEYCTEMVVAYVSIVLDGDALHLSEEERQRRIIPLMYHVELLLGAAPGSFSDIFAAIRGDRHE